MPGRPGSGFDLDMLRPPRRAKTQAREKAKGILDRQYEQGLSTLRLPWAQHALETIEAHCPTLTWEEKVRLFHDRTSASAETVVQAALFAEWNRAHARAARGGDAKKR